MLTATNTSKFRVGCGDQLLKPGESCEVDEQLAGRIKQLDTAGLLHVGEGSKRPAKGKGRAAKASEGAEDMAGWAAARVRNWASKRGREDITAALEGQTLSEAAREALEERLLELEEAEG